MLIQYIQAALEKAKYEIIEDEEPYYGEVPELKGVSATGNTLEECRRNLEEVIDEWIIFRVDQFSSLGMRSKRPVTFCRFKKSILQADKFCFIDISQN